MHTAKQSLSSMFIGLALATAIVTLVADPAWALRIDGYSAANNNRTINGAANPNFFGNTYDLSGIAVTNPGILLSPYYYVTEYHIGLQGSVTFLSNNGQLITKDVQGYQRLTTNGVASDLVVYKLSSGFTPADGVSYYPVAVVKNSLGQLDMSWYWNRQLLVFGSANQSGETAGLMAGSNTISYVGQTSFSGGDSPTEIEGFYYNATQPYQNQCGLAFGDSGYPVGLIVDGRLTALGANMGIYPADTSGSYISVSSFLPYYVDQIDAYMAQGGTGEQVTVIPEPASIALVLGGLALFFCRRRR